MDALFFLFAVIGVLGVMHWSVTNDAAGNRGPTKGLFAMRDFAAEAQERADAAKPGGKSLTRR